MVKHVVKVLTKMVDLTKGPEHRWMEMRNMLMIRKPLYGYVVMYMTLELEYQVELMGGRLTVTSQEHSGSTFTFLLPYKVSLEREPQDGPNEPSDMEEHDVVPDVVPSELSNSNSESNILLVEDNKINVMVAKSMKKQLAHNIDVVNDGVQAVRAVQTHRYDPVLMDVHMPITDDLQATRLIHSFEETGSWNAAIEAGIDCLEPSSQPSINGLYAEIPFRKRVPIAASEMTLSSSIIEGDAKNEVDV